MKQIYLGIDTSNYTTSIAISDQTGVVINNIRIPLPVKEGQMGLRQSDACFLHTKNLCALQERILQDYQPDQIGAIGVSVSPTDKEGSYMPCFMVGVSIANLLGNLLQVPVYQFSHQQNHVMAALYGSNSLHLLDREFLAFHVSGGTTDAMAVRLKDCNFEIEPLASSLDLKAGQAVDRVGGMLGIGFPAGPNLDKLACQSKKQYRIKPTLKGLDPSLSGVENQCKKMLENSQLPCDVAKYCIEFIGAALREMTRRIFVQKGEMPVLFSGGVMSNSILSKQLANEFGGFFAPPSFSADNAAGCALLARMRGQHGQ